MSAATRADGGHELVAAAAYAPYDTCGRCGQPVEPASTWEARPGVLVTLTSRNWECYGRRP